MGNLPGRWEAAWAVFKTLLFTVLFPGTVVGYLPYWLLKQRGELTPPEWSAAAIAAFVPIAAGAAVYSWCAWSFAVRGLGTPAPIDPPKVLIARGLYRHTRNPMYVGVLLVLLGESLLFYSWFLLSYSLLVWLGFHIWILIYEERALRRQFGASYEEYCRSVPRWLLRIPR